MLKYLDERVEAAIGAEVAQGEPPVSTLAYIGTTTPTNLFGFELEEPLVKADRVARNRAARLRRITVYRDDAARLRRWLSEVQIEPIAVITAKAFDALVKELGLFTLFPNQRGMVQLNSDPIMSKRVSDTARLWAHWMISLLTVVTFIFGFRTWGWSVVSPDGPGPLMGALCLLLGVLLAGNFACYGILECVSKWVFARRIHNWLSNSTWESLLVALTHDKETRTFGDTQYSSERWQRKLVLPPAPASVLDKVVRMAQHQSEGDHVLYIAAEADAIRFEKFEELFDYQIAEAEMFARREAARALRRDPILFIRGAEHGAVAIIDQYGDLPLEKELVERIVNSEHLL